MAMPRQRGCPSALDVLADFAAQLAFDGECLGERADLLLLVAERSLALLR
jgi:hypothetical protein